MSTQNKKPTAGPEAAVRGAAGRKSVPKSSTGKVAAFHAALVAWGATHQRDFPWRRTRDPYRLLVAEMMLRRTRASQVGPVFEDFVAKYPTVQALALGRPSDIALALRPLGLEWRVPAFSLMAKEIVSAHGGEVPRDRIGLLSLPGVGDYVADAVRCFGYGEPTAVVDTNTVRVAGRYLGFLTGPESRRRRDVQSAVARLVDPANPIDANLALLDLAATICTARAPHCDICPVASGCSFVAASKTTKSRHAAVTNQR